MKLLGKVSKENIGAAGRKTMVLQKQNAERLNRGKLDQDGVLTVWKSVVSAGIKKRGQGKGKVRIISSNLERAAGRGRWSTTKA